METPASAATLATYAAARAVAPVIRDHFTRQVAAAPAPGGAYPHLLPDVPAIESMIDAAFWASLRREEGRAPEISLAFLPPERAAHPLLFHRGLPLSPAALTRLAPAVERPAIHLGVWRRGDVLEVWGTTLTVPLFALVVEVVSPGLLVVKHRRSESGKFRNVAVLEGDQIKVVDEAASRLPDCPAVLASLLGFASPAAWAADAPSLLVRIAVSMRHHRRGGSMLVVPSGDHTWRESMVGPIPYAVSPPFTELAELAAASPDPEGGRVRDEAISRAVGAVAGLTAVDGATVITDGFAVLAFGVKIGPRNGAPPVEEVVVTEPIQGTPPLVVPPGQVGGTRHISAAQFVHDQRDTIALVASQDGRFTVFAWSPCEGLVHAHRVETLLL